MLCDTLWLDYYIKRRVEEESMGGKEGQWRRGGAAMPAAGCVIEEEKNDKIAKIGQREPISNSVEVLAPKIGTI